MALVEGKRSHVHRFWQGFGCRSVRLHCLHFCFGWAPIPEELLPPPAQLRTSPWLARWGGEGSRFRFLEDACCDPRREPVEVTISKRRWKQRVWIGPHWAPLVPNNCKRYSTISSLTMDTSCRVTLIQLTCGMWTAGDHGWMRAFLLVRSVSELQEPWRPTQRWQERPQSVQKHASNAKALTRNDVCRAVSRGCA